MQTTRIKKEDALLVVIDFQEKLMPFMKDAENLGNTTAKLIKGCGIMGLPAILTQQYTKGLGETIPVILNALNASRVPFEKIEKTSFSCYGELTFVETLEKIGRKTVIICGIEAHVCVQQTALDLLENGYTVYLIHDCVSSRSNNDKKYAQRRISEAGAIGTTYESILFELCASAKAPEFKAISALVK